MKRIILSQRVPDKTLSCGAINISPYKAMEISLGEGSTMFMDSLLVEYADEEEPAFHDWLLFHSFLLNDTYPIEGFNNIHPREAY